MRKESGMAALPPIFTKNAYAYAELRRRIVSGAMEQGSVLSQAKLAQEIGVSTTPLREALRQLAAEGLVELKSHSDARVAALTADEARHLYAIRESLDPLAAGLAAESRTPSDVSRIEAALAQLQPLRTAGDLAALAAHREFHRAIYTAAANPLLTGILEGLWDKADRYRQIGLQSGKVTNEELLRVQDEHCRIAEAVVAGDAERAREAMHRHVAGSLGRRAINVLAAE
jgi:DNA-binding GntR family transcriptional regulator